MKNGSLVLKFALNMCSVDSIAVPPSGQVAIMVPMSYGANLVCNSEETAATLALALSVDDLDYSGAGRPIVMLEFDMDESDAGLQQVRDILKRAGFEVSEEGVAPWLQMLKANQS